MLPDKNKVCTIFAGVEGVGRSSALGLMCRGIPKGYSLPYECKGEDIKVYLQFDPVLGFILDSRRINFSSSRRDIATDMIGRLAIDCVKRCFPFALRTDLTEEYWVELVKTLREYNYKINMVYIGVANTEVCIQRARAGIDVNRLAKNMERRLDYVANILEYINEATFYSNDCGFRLEGVYKDGVFSYSQFGASDASWVHGIEVMLRTFEAGGCPELIPLDLG